MLFRDQLGLVKASIILSCSSYSVRSIGPSSFYSSHGLSMLSCDSNATVLHQDDMSAPFER